MRKLSVFLVINGLFAILAAILLLVAAVKLLGISSQYYEPGFELTLYIITSIETFILGIASLVVASALKDDANRLDEVYGAYKNNAKNNNKKTISQVEVKVVENKKQTTKKSDEGTKSLPQTVSSEDLSLSIEEFVEKYDPSFFEAINSFYANDEKELKNALTKRYNELINK